MPTILPPPGPLDDDAPVSPASPADYFPEITPEEGKTLDAETFRIAERRLSVVRLYRRGLSMRAIAEQVKCSPGTVHADIHAVLEGVKRQADRTARDHLADMLQRLADREMQIETDLERSRGEQVETVGGRRVLVSGNVDTTSVKRRTKYGDPRLHALLLKCWELRAKLLGLLKNADADPGQVPVKLVSGIDPMELA